MKDEKPCFEPMPEEATGGIRENEGAETAAPADPQTEARRRREEEQEALREARRALFRGLAWLAGGILFSLLSYRFAKAGQTYYVATGAVLWGAFDALRGLWRMLVLYRRRGERNRMAATVAAAVAVVALAGWLGPRAWRTVAVAGQFVETEQTYDYEEVGLRVRIPAGYTAIQETAEPETDSTYATRYMWVTDGKLEMNVQAVEGNVGEEATTEDVIDYCMSRDSDYYDGGICLATERRTAGGREWLYSEGHRTEYPDDLFTLYDVVHAGSLVTVGIIYPAAEAGTEACEATIGELLAGIELEEPR